MESLLQGMRVIDFGRFIAAPYCAALLGDMGADVIRVERIEGGEDRYLPPVADSGEGGTFLQLNRNKRCLTLDMGRAEGREIIQRLLAGADAMVINMPLPTMKKLGLDYATVSGLHPRLVMTMVTAFGSQGPYADRVGFDLVGQAMSGAMYLSGSPEAPQRAAVNYVDFSTGLACALGTVSALWARERSGQGQLVEGSLLKSALTITNSWLMEQAVRQTNRPPMGNRGAISAPTDAFPTKDGWIVIQTVGQAMFDRVCELIGQPGLKTDPRFADDKLRGDNGAEISLLVGAWLRTLTRAEALAALDAAKIPAAPVYTPQETLDDPHVQAAGLLRPAHFAGLDRPFPLAPHPVEYSASATGLQRPPPRLGEHTDQILAELGYNAADISRLHDQGVV